MRWINWVIGAGVLLRTGLGIWNLFGKKTPPPPKAKPQNLSAVLQQKLLDYAFTIFMGPEYTQARRAIEQKDYPTAARLLEKLRTQEPEHPLVLILLSHAYAGLEQYERALNTINQVFELRQINEHALHPTDAPFGYDAKSFKVFAEMAYTARAYVYMLLKRYAEAAADYQEALPFIDDKMTLYLVRAQAFEAAGKVHDAIENYEQAYVLGKRNVAAILKQLYFEEAGKPDTPPDIGLIYMDRFIALDNQFRAAFRLQAQLYATKKDYEAAITALNRASALAPDNNDNLSRAIWYYMLKQHHEALTNFAQYIEQGGSNYQVFYFRARCYQALGDYAAALADATRAFPLHDASDPVEAKLALRLRPTIYYESDQFEAALADYTTVVEKLDEAMDAYNASLCCYMLRRFDDALKYIQIAIQRRDPPDADDYHRQAFIYARLKQWDAAYQSIERGLEFAQTPEEREILLAVRVVVLRHQQQTQAALEHCNQALQEFPDSLYLYGERSSLYAYLGQGEAALHDAETLQRLFPANAGIYDTLGLVYFVLGRYDDVLTAAAEGFTQHPNYMTRCLLMALQAVSHLALNHPAEAQAAWQALLILNPLYREPDAVIEDFILPDSIASKIHQLAAQTTG